MRHEHAREILGAICTVQEDKTKVWYVKMAEVIEIGERKIIGLISLSSNCARSEDLTWETYWSWLIIVM